MKKLILAICLICTFFFTNPVYGHKLISHDNSHQNFENALIIPDHKMSWAIHENLDKNEARFYSFEAKQGDLFYANIVIPKINGLENYAPTLKVVSANMLENTESFNKGWSSEKFLYESKFPGNEFYEPFGQVTYWERQEIRIQIPFDGKYTIIVMDEKNQSGKYSLAIGTIEDFSAFDFVIILPKAWFETKIFVNDFQSIGIVFSLVIGIPGIIVVRQIKTRNRKKRVNNASTI